MVFDAKRSEELLRRPLSLRAREFTTVIRIHASACIHGADVDEVTVLVEVERSRTVGLISTACQVHDNRFVNRDVSEPGCEAPTYFQVVCGELPDRLTKLKEAGCCR